MSIHRSDTFEGPLGVDVGTYQWNNLTQISHNLQMPLLILIPERNDDLGSNLG